MSTATLSSKKTLITKTLSDIAAAVERVQNDGLQQFSEAASPGDAVRQGDVVIQYLGNNDDVQIPAHIYAAVAEPVLQLAPGNTKGSRHCLASAEGVEMWLPVQTDEAVARHVYAKNGAKMPRGPVVGWRLEYREERGALEEAMAMAGPIFKLSQPNVVAHPEHGDWALPCGTYRVIFQRTLDEMERIQRVLD